MNQLEWKSYFEAEKSHIYISCTAPVHLSPTVVINTSNRTRLSSLLSVHPSSTQVRRPQYFLCTGWPDFLQEDIFFY